MKILLDIPDNKASSLMEVLKSIPYVKIKTLTEEKSRLLQEIKKAVVEINLVKAGNLEARPIEDLLRKL